MAELSPMEIQHITQGMTADQKMLFSSQLATSQKDRTVAILLSVFLGTLGVDRFYLGDVGLGVLKLLTAGLCGVMWLVDLFLIMGRADSINRAKAEEIAAAIRYTG